MESWQIIHSYGEKCGLSHEQIEELHDCFDRVEGNPHTRMIFERSLERSRNHQITPTELEEHFSPYELPRVYLLLILSLFPMAEALYRERHWPMSMWEEIRTDVAIWVAHQQENYGFVGLQWRIFSWEVGVFTGKTVQLGRLQCNTSYTFEEPFSVYRNPADGAVRLAEQSPGSSWTCELAPGDPVINLHIPASGGMDIDACRQSIRRMTEFFAHFLPDYNYRAFFCESWLLDRQLQDLLPPHSNIVRFQQLGHLFDHSPESETIWRVFGEKGVREGVNAVSHRTSMQKSLAEFVNRGGKFHSGGLIILRDEVDSAILDAPRQGATGQSRSE